MTEKIEAIKEEFYALHLRGQGRLDDAIEIYRKRLELEPPGARTRMQLAVTLSQKGDAAEALHQARIAVASEPDNPGLRCIFVNILVEHKQWSEAVAECKEQLRMWPDKLLPHISLGEAYHGMGDLNAAIDSYEVGAGLGVGDPGTLDALGRLYDKAGRLDDAINVYRKLLAFAPRFRMGRLHLGKALAASGRVVEARDEWARLLAKRDLDEGARGQPEPAPDEASILASEYLQQYGTADVAKDEK
jgi:tetratricopeptide (TPR) repeat protein